jgi:quercetin dioxygenase-like cupin family protein
MIRNYRDLNRDTGNRIIGSVDGAPNYLMLYNGAMAPGQVSHAEAGGHTHPWEHVVFILEGQATIVCDGKEFTVSQGDGVLVPPDTFHQWRNTSQAPMSRVTFNPLASEAGEG